MLSRMERAEAFVDYLKQEEARERAEFLLPDSDDIMGPIAKAFEEDKQRALESARRNLPNSGDTDEISEKVV